MKDILQEGCASNKIIDKAMSEACKLSNKHEQVIEEYKIMIDGFKLSKLNLEWEFILGWRGGASWPFWVTKVCCELLVNGSPPSAIPSSIGTLIATLYGKEPKKLPCLNYVRQC
jgi:hypothetical protein